MEPGAKRQRAKYIFHAIVVAIVVWTVAFDRKGPQDDFVRFGVAGMLLLIYFAIASRRVHDFITKHTWKIYALGILSFGLSVGVFLFAASNIPPDSKFSDITAQIAAGLIMLGIVVVMLPRTTKEYRDANDDTGPFARARHYRNVPSVTGFSGRETGVDAVKFVLGNALIFLRIAGPWTLIIWALPFAIVQLIAYSNGAITSPIDPVGTKMPADFVFTAWLVAFAIVSWLSIPVVAVAWHRYVLESRIPVSPIALPDRRARLYLVLYGAGPLVLLGVTAWAIRSFSPYLVNAVGSGNAALIEGVVRWIFVAAFVFASTPYATILPTVAVEEDSDPQSYLLSKPRLLRSVCAGALFAVAPFVVAQQLFALATRSRLFPVTDFVSGAESFVQVLLLMAALAAWATYLSRVYETVKDRSIPQVAI